jgi:hypothetical protein
LGLGETLAASARYRKITLFPYSGRRLDIAAVRAMRAEGSTHFVPMLEAMDGDPVVPFARLSEPYRQEPV